MEAKKITVSGNYRKAQRGIVDFSNLSGIVPGADEDVLMMHVMSRYVPMWVDKDPKYKDRLTSVREVFIDTIEEVKEHKFSFIGKNIQDMTMEELQDVATAFDLRSIPLYKKASLNATREAACIEYLAKVSGNIIDTKDPRYDYAALPLIKTEDKVRRDKTGKVTSEEYFSMQANGEMDLESLKKLADSKGIVYSPNIGYDKLYSRIFD